MSRACDLALLALLAWPASAHAFSDPELFQQAAAQGGGAGRFFTGSPVDGHACSVCHVPVGRAPELRIDGLPERFESGARYQVSLRWPGAEVSHALQLELAQKDGTHAALTLQEPSALPPESHCDGDPDSEPAVYAVNAQRRRVLGVSDCGASALDFEFTAPDAPQLYFALSMVRSDREGDAEGDGVLELRRVLYNVTEPAPGAGCSAVGRSGRPDAGAWLLALGLLLLLRRRARRAHASRLLRLRTTRVALALVLAACSEVPIDASPGDGADASYLIDRFTPQLDGGGADCPAVERRLTFNVRTTSFGGRWRPRNVGAIWIEDAEGTFVKTLERWATVRAKYLVRFMETTNNDVVDAVTRATLSKHEPHEAWWDLSNRARCEVPDGPYRLVIELTDQNRAGVSFAIEFEKGPQSFERTFEDQDTFHDMVLRLD